MYVRPYPYLDELQGYMGNHYLGVVDRDVSLCHLILMKGAPDLVKMARVCNQGVSNYKVMYISVCNHRGLYC